MSTHGLDKELVTSHQSADVSSKHVLDHQDGALGGLLVDVGFLAGDAGVFLLQVLEAGLSGSRNDVFARVLDHALHDGVRLG